jgi:hypothetical protein
MISTLLFAAALAVQPNDTTSAPQQKAVAQRATKLHDKTAEKHAAPDPELIEFLGDYEDAADGLDPIGLSEQMTDDKKAADEKKKDGHGP